jgi:hypothetical protein
MDPMDRPIRFLSRFLRADYSTPQGRWRRASEVIRLLRYGIYMPMNYSSDLPLQQCLRCLLLRGVEPNAYLRGSPRHRRYKLLDKALWFSATTERPLP